MGSGLDLTERQKRWMRRNGGWPRCSEPRVSIRRYSTRAFW